MDQCTMDSLRTLITDALVVAKTPLITVTTDAVQGHPAVSRSTKRVVTINLHPIDYRWLLLAKDTAGNFIVQDLDKLWGCQVERKGLDGDG